MTHGEKIAQSRARIRQLESELEKEEAMLRELEASCTHSREALGEIVIRIPDDVIRHPAAECLDCGVRSFVSKRDPHKRRYPTTVLHT